MHIPTRALPRKQSRSLVESRKPHTNPAILRHCQPSSSIFANSKSAQTTSAERQKTRSRAPSAPIVGALIAGETSPRNPARTSVSGRKSPRAARINPICRRPRGATSSPEARLLGKSRRASARNLARPSKGKSRTSPRILGGDRLLRMPVVAPLARTGR